jgi:hypothetical protein
LCNALPPEGALRLRPGKAGSAAPADMSCGDATLTRLCEGRDPRHELLRYAFLEKLIAHD